MICSSESAIRPPNTPPRETQTVESLRGSHLVNEMEIYVDEIRIYLVGLPDLLEQRLGHEQIMPSGPRRPLSGSLRCGLFGLAHRSSLQRVG